MKVVGIHSFVRALCVSAAILIACTVHAEDYAVLWWQVGDFTDPDSLGDVAVERVNGGGWTTAEDLGVTYARIRDVTSGDYLYMLNPETGDFELESINVPMTWVADVSKFASGSPEAVFVIELGNYESGSNWSTLALSSTATYADLAANNHIETASGYIPNPVAIWMPTSYVVPEPTSGMLVLVGAALLALRRRRGLSRRG